MKIQTAERSIEMSGDFEQTTAVIICNDAMFTLLADKLYRNKIRAAIRELTCNAADAHTEGNNPNPFIVSLPNGLDPYFKVTDEGLGLAHKDVMNLYMNFGASTRAGADNVTGGFGLGSKAPYAYVQTFGVVSWFDGVKRTYVCFRNEKGVPATTLTGTEDTDSPNGLQVSFRVEPKDFEEFYREAAHVLRAFTQPYKVNGAELDLSEEIEQEGDGWKIAAPKTSGYYNTVCDSVVRMGNVDYPIPRESLRNLDGALSNLWEKLGIILSVKVGDLSPTPSREDLEITSQMEALLVERLEDIQKTLVAKFDEQLEEQPNMWEARFKLRNLRDDSSFQLITNHGRNYDPTWKGKEIIDGMNIRHKTSIRIVRYERSEKYVGGTSRVCVTTRDVGKYTPQEDDILVLDNLQGTDFKLRNYVRHELTGRLGNGRMVLITVDTRASLKEFLTWLGKGQRELLIATQVDLSDETKAKLKELRAANRAERTHTGQAIRRKRGTVKGYSILEGASDYNKEDGWEEIDGGVPYKGKKGVYVVLNRWEVVDLYPGAGDIKPGRFRRSLDCLQRYSWDDFEVVAVKKADADKLEGEPGWVLLSTLVSDVHRRVENSAERHAAVAHKSSSINWRSYEMEEHPFWKKMDSWNRKDKLRELIDLASKEDLATTSTFVKLLKGLTLHADNHVETELGNLRVLMPQADYCTPPAAYTELGTLSDRIEADIYTPLGELWEKYPMMSVVEVRNNPGQCVGYINLVDSQETNND